MLTLVDRGKLNVSLLWKCIAVILIQEMNHLWCVSQIIIVFHLWVWREKFQVLYSEKAKVRMKLRAIGVKIL